MVLRLFGAAPKGGSNSAEDNIMRWYSLGALGFSMLMVACSGNDGATGAPGTQGATGPSGGIGATGPAGPAGATGPTGATGLAGATGPVGVTGASGSPGATGAAGLTGANGVAGPIGLAGATGAVGATGATGPKGDNGATGAIGATGPSGGPMGATGDTGATGATGTSGTTFLTGTGIPAANLGAVGDLYLDTLTSNLYQKGAGGWTLLGNLANPGAQMNGWIWYSFVYPATVAGNAVTNAVNATDHVSATITTAAGTGNGGGIGWHFTNPVSPVNLQGYHYLQFTLNYAVLVGSVPQLVLVLAQNGMNGCNYSFAPIVGTSTVQIDLSLPPSNCWADFGAAATPASYHPTNVDSISIEVPIGGAATAVRSVSMALSNVQLIY